MDSWPNLVAVCRLFSLESYCSVQLNPIFLPIIPLATVALSHHSPPLTAQPVPSAPMCPSHTSFFTHTRNLVPLIQLFSPLSFASQAILSNNPPPSSFILFSFMSPHFFVPKLFQHYPNLFIICLNALF